MNKTNGTITKILKNGHLYDITTVLTQDLIDLIVSNAKDSTSAAMCAEDIVATTQELIGGKKIPYFLTSEYYDQYTMVMYRREGETSAHLYQAVVNNGPGEWQDQNWKQTSFYDFLVNNIQVETVKVRCQYSSDQSPILNINVQAIYDGITHTVKTDELGYATFTIAYGTQYTIVSPNMTGYVTPKTITKVANSNVRNINIPYRLYTVGLSVIKDNGEEVNMSVWNIADNAHAVLLKLSTSAGNCVIEVHNEPFSAQWSSINLQFPSLPLLSNAQAAADYDGFLNTQKIEEDWSVLVTTNPTLKIPAVTGCRNRKVVINGVEYQGALPAAGQLVAIKSNIYDINAALLTLGGNQLAITSGYWWSSSQRSLSNAWSLDNGSLGSNFYKSYAYSVVPVFDF